MQRNKQISYGVGVLLGGLGVFLASERGRDAVRQVVRNFESAPNLIEQFANATQSELDRIQETLDQIAARLQVAG